MKRVFLLLFILPIVLSAFLTFGINLSSSFGYVSPVFRLGSYAGFLVGIFIYSKLWKSTKENPSNQTPLRLWVGMILSFFLIQAIYFAQEHIQDKKIIEENRIWFQEHCNPIQKGVDARGYSYETLCVQYKAEGF